MISWVFLSAYFVYIDSSAKYDELFFFLFFFCKLIVFLYNIDQSGIFVLNIWSFIYFQFWTIFESWLPAFIDSEESLK